MGTQIPYGKDWISSNFRHIKLIRCGLAMGLRRSLVSHDGLAASRRESRRHHVIGPVVGSLWKFETLRRIWDYPAEKAKRRPEFRIFTRRTRDPVRNFRFS